MYHCKKCGSLNPETARFCKECGKPLNEEFVFETVFFKSAFTKLMPICNFFFALILLDAFLYLIFGIGYFTFFNKELFIWYWCNIIGIIGFLLVTLNYFLFRKYNIRWKRFDIRLPFSETKEKIKREVFLANKSSEVIFIKENTNGELKLKDKSIGARGYFHLIEDKDGNAVIIGEKYNAQAFIRSVIGKDVNFIEN